MSGTLVFVISVVVVVSIAFSIVVVFVGVGVGVGVGVVVVVFVFVETCCALIVHRSLLLAVRQRSSTGYRHHVQDMFSARVHFCRKQPPT